MSVLPTSKRLAFPAFVALAFLVSVVLSLFSVALAQPSFKPGADDSPATPAYERALLAMGQECAGDELKPGALEACARLALLLRRMLAPAESSDLVIAADEWLQKAAEALAAVQGSPPPRMTQAEHTSAQAQRGAILHRVCD